MERGQDCRRRPKRTKKCIHLGDRFWNVWKYKGGRAGKKLNYLVCGISKGKKTPNANKNLPLDRKRKNQDKAVPGDGIARKQGRWKKKERVSTVRHA